MKGNKMKNRNEIATLKFQGGYNCAQSVLYAFCEELNINKETALKLACGFGAGMGRKEEVCGAVTGGIIAIGAKYGKYEQSDKTSKDITYKKTRELMDNFKRIQGTYICKNLLNGIDLTKDEGQKEFNEKDFHNKVCIPCVQSAVEILEKIL
jgi:C_GCAxxG_C_C family probable redox protein